MPEGLLADSYHPDEPPHIHDPADERRRARLGKMGRKQVVETIERHLMARGRIEFKELLMELNAIED